MANIPLSEVPQAPSLASVAKPDLTTLTPPQDNTWRQIRGMIDQGAAAMMQRPYNIQGNPDAAAEGRAQAANGEAQANQGKAITQSGLDLGKGLVDGYDMIKTNAAATFYNNYTLAKAQLKEQMQSSDPSTWQIQQQKFNASYPDTILKGINPIGLHAIAPDILKKQAQDTAETGIDAHVKQNELEKHNQTTAISTAIDNGDYKTASALVASMQENGLLSPVEASAKAEMISGAKGKAAIAQQMAIDPDGTKQKLQDAFDRGNSKDYDPSKPLIPEWPNITRAELPSYIKAANDLKGRQQDAIFSNVWSRSENHEFPDVASLKADQQFQRLSPENQQAAIDAQLTKWTYGDTADSARSDVIAAIGNYNPAKDSAYETKQAISRQILSTVPPSARGDLLKKLNDTFSESADEKVQRTAIGELHAVLKNASGNDGSTKSVYAADDATEAFKKAWSDPKQRGNGSLQDARKIIDILTQKTQWGAGANEGLQNKPVGGFMNWLKGTKPQASNDDGSGLGKVTSYGYQNDETPDGNTQTGKSAIGKLSIDSLAVSPDIERQLKSQGISIGDKVQLKMADGSTVVRTWDDRTAKQYKGKPLTGRFDFYSPKGLADQEGTQVVGVSKI